MKTCYLRNTWKLELRLKLLRFTPFNFFVNISNLGAQTLVEFPRDYIYVSDFFLWVFVFNSDSHGILLCILNCCDPLLMLVCTFV